MAQAGGGVILNNASLAGLGVDATPGSSYLKYELPPARKAGVTVESVDELVGKLRNEAKVL